MPARLTGRAFPATWAGWAAAALLTASPLCAQESATPPGAHAPGEPGPVPLPAVPVAQPEEHPLPINLPTALQLANVAPLDIALASQRIEAAAAQLGRARSLWLPSVFLGVDYFRHDGQIQDVGGTVFTTSRSSFLAGGGPRVLFAVTDALYAPLAARQIVRARQAERQATANDTLLAVAESYFDVQQARGELAGSLDALRRAEDLVRRTERLAEGLAPRVEVNRARTELARRRQAVEASRERWETASAELARLLRLAPSALVVPLEEPHLSVRLVDPHAPPDELIGVALDNRPELAGRQALVRAAAARLRQEEVRPLLPSVVVRGSATPGDAFSTGIFGGGLNDNLSNFGARNTFNVQLLWEFQNLGFGNRAAIRERQAESEAALIELLRVRDFVAAEVVQALAQARRAANRVRAAEDEVANAVETAAKNLEGLSQTRRVGEVLVLVFRPQEVVASIQALDQAYRGYYGAVNDANRAQFRLYRALGHPAQRFLDEPPGGPPCPPEPSLEAPNLKGN